MRVGFVGAGLMGAPIAGDVAGGLGLEAPLLALTRARFDEAAARYGDDVDYGSVARLVGW